MKTAWKTEHEEMEREGHDGGVDEGSMEEDDEVGGREEGGEVWW